MSKKLKYSVFCVDFRNFSSAEEMESFFQKVGLDLVGKSWYDAHIGKWIKGKKVNRVWIDSITLSLVAYETDDDQMLYPGFAQFLQDSPCIDTNFKYGEVKFNHRKDITIDSILEKILKSGTESLTDFERNFLDKNSENI
jgi:hypothetical protein